MIQDSKARLHKKTDVPTKLGSLSTRQLHSIFVKPMIPLHHIRYICLYSLLVYNIHCRLAVSTVCTCRTIIYKTVVAIHFN